MRVVPGTWWIKHSWPTPFNPSAKERSSWWHPYLFCFHSYQSGWKWSSCQEFNLLSHQLLFLIDMIQWRSYTGHTQRSSKLKFCLMLIPSNDVTKDDSKNSTFGAPLKKGNNYIFNMKPPYLWNLNWSQTQCEGLLFLEYKWWYFYTWLLKCLARGCYNSKRGQMTYATTIGQNMPIHVCANDTD